MNAPVRAAAMAAQPLHVAALAALAPAAGENACPEAIWLQGKAAACGNQRGKGARALLDQWQALPPDSDRRLRALGAELQLSTAEIVALAVAAAVETDAMVGRVLSWLQAPTGGSRPTLGLICALANALGISGALSDILNGAARTTGLLQIEAGSRPLPDSSVLTPVPVVMALQGGESQFPGVGLGKVDAAAFAPSACKEAARQARALTDGGMRVLAVRSGHPRQARAAAIQIADALGAKAALLEESPPPGLGPWLWLAGAVPVLCAELAPGETRRVPRLPGYGGPILVATGPDGCFEWDGDTVGSWRVPMPTAAERERLWALEIGDATLARDLGRVHRYDAAQIRLLGRAARHRASLEGAAPLCERHVTHAARSGIAGELGTLAELIPEPIPDEALVIPAPLREALLSLTRRCLARESLVDCLGAAARTRYRPGVRALFVGPSGTGKTLAAGWLATRLGLPLYRVDVASVTSKYIGETEKNLAQLFARAEHTEVMLLFDEADSLFGKRTDVKESNDRFANAQTNYLLQRIESFEGIAVLTSNSRARFDSAFTRRLDAIVEFPAPAPEDRRALWAAHLGAAHGLSLSELNRLAGACDLAGGHIRNVVLSAAVAAGANARPIAYSDVVGGVVQEFRKLGKQPPAGLEGALTPPASEPQP